MGRIYAHLYRNSIPAGSGWNNSGLIDHYPNTVLGGESTWHYTLMFSEDLQRIVQSSEIGKDMFGNILFEASFNDHLKLEPKFKSVPISLNLKGQLTVDQLTDELDQMIQSESYFEWMAEDW